MYKSKLLELCQQKRWALADFKVTKKGPDHSPEFQATVTVDGQSFDDHDWHRSSKLAQNESAKLALHHLSAPKWPPVSLSAVTGANAQPGNENLEFSSSVSQSDDIACLQEYVQPTLPLITLEQPDGGEGITCESLDLQLRKGHVKFQSSVAQSLDLSYLQKYVQPELHPRKGHVEFPSSVAQLLDLAHLQEYAQPKLPVIPMEQYEVSAEDTIHPPSDFSKLEINPKPQAGNTASRVIVLPHDHPRYQRILEELNQDEPNQEEPNSGLPGKSKLNSTLISATKSNWEKPQIVSRSNSSASKRGRPTSTVTDSGKNFVERRRLSVDTSLTANPLSELTMGNITPISEIKIRSANGQGKSETPISGMSRLTRRKKFCLISSASYWVSQIKYSESAGKHSISLGFFRLALEAGCEPFQVVRDELKSYAQRYDLGEPLKELLRLYSILDISEHVQISRTSSNVPKKEGSLLSTGKVYSPFTLGAMKLKSRPFNANTIIRK